MSGQLHAAPGPVLLDEWPRWPQIWDQVRRAVDDGASPGRFLTGSAVPAHVRVHTGAGRIAVRWLGQRYGEDFFDTLVITAGRDAYRCRDGIAVIAAALLGP